MAYWKLSVIRTGTVNGVRLEKTMFVEMVTTSISDPLRTNTSTSHPQIGALFMNKYGVDLYKKGLISPTNIRSERIS